MESNSRVVKWHNFKHALLHKQEGYIKYSDVTCLQNRLCYPRCQNSDHQELYDCTVRYCSLSSMHLTYICGQIFQNTSSLKPTAYCTVREY